MQTRQINRCMAQLDCIVMRNKNNNNSSDTTQKNQHTDPREEKPKLNLAGQEDIDERQATKIVGPSGA